MAVLLCRSPHLHVSHAHTYLYERHGRSEKILSRIVLLFPMPFFSLQHLFVWLRLASGRGKEVEEWKRAQSQVQTGVSGLVSAQHDESAGNRNVEFSVSFACCVISLEEGKKKHRIWLGFSPRQRLSHQPAPVQSSECLLFLLLCISKTLLLSWLGPAWCGAGGPAHRFGLGCSLLWPRKTVGTGQMAAAGG